MLLVLVSSVSAVTRTIGTGTITYNKESDMTGLTKGYWAIEDTLSGCTLAGVSCGIGNYACSKVGNAVRLVAYSDDAGVGMPNSVTIAITGTGTCSLSGNYTEAWKTSSATTLGLSTPMASGQNIELGGQLEGLAQINKLQVITDYPTPGTEYSYVDSIWDTQPYLPTNSKVSQIVVYIDNKGETDNIFARLTGLGIVSKMLDGNNFPPEPFILIDVGTELTMQSSDINLVLEIGHESTNGNVIDETIPFYIGYQSCTIPGDGLDGSTCDNIVSSAELGVAITKWVNGDFVMTRDQLGTAIQSWVSGG